jgi:hypothetical protein
MEMYLRDRNGNLHDAESLRDALTRFTDPELGYRLSFSDGDCTITIRVDNLQWQDGLVSSQIVNEYVNVTVDDVRGQEPCHPSSEDFNPSNGLRLVK